MANLRVHGVLNQSRANGPGIRMVVWVQGCTLACSGCFNPNSHTPNAGTEITVEELAQSIRATTGIEGITISGGEPLQQLTAVTELCRLIRADTSLSIVLFTGFTPAEIAAMGRCQPNGQLEILGLVDVMIAGRYEQSQHLAQGLRGSANKELIFLTERYGRADFETVKAGEVIIGRDGQTTSTGIAPLRLTKTTKS